MPTESARRGEKSNYGVRGEVASVKWESVGDHSGVLVAAMTWYLRTQSLGSTNNRSWMQFLKMASLERGIVTFGHSAALNVGSITEPKPACWDSQIKEEDGVLFLIPTQ